MNLLSNSSKFQLGAGSGALFISGDTANGHAYIEHAGVGNFYLRSDTGFDFTRYSGGPHEKYATFIETRCRFDIFNDSVIIIATYYSFIKYAGFFN